MKNLFVLFLLATLLTASCSKDGEQLLDLIEQGNNDDDDDTILDTDNDGVSDEDEKADGTDPTKADTDGDGINDGDEKNDKTNPLVADTDEDGVHDGDEKTDGTNPLVADTDEDGVKDGIEKTDGTDPLKSDTDKDGISDGDEKADGTNPLKLDSDDDGINDGEEKTNKTNPLNADSDEDGISDGDEAADGTNPLQADTDGDGVTDGQEKSDNTHPIDSCSLILNSQTLAPQAAWTTLDCDGDGVNNINEINAGTDPLVADVVAEASPLVGTWVLVSATINDGTATTVVANQTYSLSYTASSTNENSQATFSENPNEIVSNGDYTTIINFNFLGTDYSETLTSASPLTTGDWNVENDELQLSANEIVDGNYEIVTLTDSSLILKTPINRVIRTGGVDLDTKGTLVITLSKQ